MDYIKCMLVGLSLIAATACAPRCHTQTVEFTWFNADGSIQYTAPQSFMVCAAQ